mmetsp:Transcript_25252/g.79668  ORF Transcript_25252/g.79668 Transcript_25252/m.79668 type:complete len:220 (+) Transcript_25252:769-1428(+)
MRWISFFMAAESAWPTFGSRASCISFSRAIFRSQRRTWRSASSTSWVIWPLSSRTRSTALSMSRHWPSISLSFCTNSVSIIWLELASSLDLESCRTTAPLMRSMSKRRCFMAFSSSRISCCCAPSWPSMRTFFCSRTIFRLRWSLSWPLRRSVSVESARSCVCFWIQSFCISEHSRVRSAMPLRMCLSLASCGPATSASPASASSFVRFSSYSRLRRST